MKRRTQTPKVSARDGWQSRRGRVAQCVLPLLFLGAAASQANLQILNKDTTVDRANKMHRFEFTDPEYAKRGQILARDGEPLARDDGRYDLAIDFKKCPNTEPFWLDLSAATGIPSSEFASFADEAARSNKPKWEREWPRAIAWSQSQTIDALVGRWRADGVGISTSGYRSYPLGEAASCLIGIVRKGFLPVKKGEPAYDRALAQHRLEPGGAADELTGLERSQDRLLRGKDGKQVGVKDRNGNFLPMRLEWQEPKKDGDDLQLTLDADLQTFASAQVKKVVEETHADSAVAIVQDPKTGELLAIANYPSFDPYTPDGNYSRLGPSGGLNQAYMSCVEPGSMFKILTLAKALDAGVVHMSDHFLCAGEKVVIPHSKPIKCDLHGGTRAMGMLDPVHAIARSCNIWAATWARDIGREKFKSYLRSLGLLDRPDIGVPDCRPALVSWNDPARQLQLANLGFGQSINATPLALAGAFSTLANDGQRVPSRLIQKIGARVVSRPTPKRILSSEACKNVVKSMVAVMEDEHGTGRSLRIPGYCIAGKTGTAQKMGSKNKGHVSNFVGFVPAQNPRAVILVMVDRPQGKKYYGAEVAGPVFRSIAQQVIHKFGLQPTEPIERTPSRTKTTPVTAPEDVTDNEPIQTRTIKSRSPLRVKSKRISDDA